jgi:hypothetical protein
MIKNKSTLIINKLRVSKKRVTDILRHRREDYGARAKIRGGQNG